MARASLLALALALVTGCAQPAIATGSLPPVEVHHGLRRGNDYRALSERERWLYAGALLEGMLLSPLFGAEKKGGALERLEDCVEKMTDEQLAAILDKYLRDNPERWHDYIHVIMYSALAKTCTLYP